MKRIILYSFCVLFAVTGCRKEDNSKLPDVVRVPTPLLQRDIVNADKVIPPLAPATFKGKFTVDLFFQNDIKPQKFDVVIMKNADPSQVVTFKENINTFPTTLDITGQQLIDLFGVAPTSGDQYDIGVNITTQSGEMFEAFPRVGTPYGPSVGNQPGASVSVRYLVPCPFNADEYNGNFEVLADEWADYAVGAVIPVTKINDHQISFKYAADDAQPIILDVNLANNDITVTNQVYGSYAGDVFSAESVPGDFSAVNPCDVSLSVRLKHSTPGFSSDFTIRLRKKQ